MVDFGYAKFHGGWTYLRYDDTNPEAEEGRFFQSILESVRWLGFEPWKITYSSDNFQRLYELAVELIRRGKGYVCTCDGKLGGALSCDVIDHARQARPVDAAVDKIKEDRGSSQGAPKACVHRERPVEESLAEFERMRLGEYKEKEACLRMKMDLGSGNPYMWDTIAYRVKKAAHHRTGDKWSESGLEQDFCVCLPVCWRGVESADNAEIYPTYDFTHCLCDSFENIS